jgi:hypothetical protein
MPAPSRRLGRRINLAAICLCLSGCATVEPIPYQKPAPDASLQQREELYAQYRTEGGWEGGLTIGGKYPVIHHGAYETFARYFDASGDTVSAARCRHGGIYRYWGYAAVTGFVAGEAALLDTHPGTPSSALAEVAAFTGGISFLVMQAWSRYYNFAGAQRSFNAYLKRDLGLPADYEPK